ncbi:outer membrane protein assembly factor BamA [Planktotalea arctica]|uniref:outer membrane protein assembly factor BamA n=1 Tax=Planktotalea arctica TaxID=1481893 RepID=UPI000A174451|nr:outer membrane protein assembly factor BamA [Planktotalea arctica]
MINIKTSGAGRRMARVAHMRALKSGAASFALALSVSYVALPSVAEAQQYRFSSVSIEGNQRIEPSTILSYAGIARGETVSAAQLNDAYQRVLGSGLFETVVIEPRGNRLVIEVTEFPTINRINFEGNRRIKDDALNAVIQSQARRVFNPSTAERDATQIAESYAVQGRVGATVNPRIIRRSDNRVDLVFEIFEGGVTEIERVGFVGNQVYSDARLRRVLETKQAGLLRAFVKKDTFVPDRIEFDKQVLRDFYLSRGYVDFRTTGVNAELARERDGYFVTFNIEEGQQFRFGQITTISEIPEADEVEFQDSLKIRPGVVYTPSLVENSIARMERLAIKKGLNFVRVEPRISRNDRDLSLDVEFVLVRGPRVFVERIDIEGNVTTLDRVVRRQFRIVEGDPFNPREIRESAERIRFLGFFSDADVQAREGSAPDQVIVDVDVSETTTGSLTFGGTFSTSTGPGAVVKYNESNFLGRGQKLGLAITTGTDNRQYSLNFAEPAFLGRDLRFGLDLSYIETDNQNAVYDTNLARFRPSFEFPVSENGRVQLRYTLDMSEMTDLASTAGALITSEAARGTEWSSALGYTYSYDTRRSGLNPNAGVLLEFGQDFGGLTGNNQYIKTTAKAIAQTKVLNEELTLRATLEGGLLNYISGSGRATDRFFMGSSVMRGFDPGGIGPREVNGATNDSLGGNSFVVARFEAEFPLGLPEEYGISGGLFYDVGSLWSLDQTNADVINEGFKARQVIGASLFWKTPVGPLRFNFSRALSKETGDQEQTFDLSISTEF